jgi:hypothetical protein
MVPRAGTLPCIKADRFLDCLAGPRVHREKLRVRVGVEFDGAGEEGFGSLEGFSAVHAEEGPSGLT